MTHEHVKSAGEAARDNATEMQDKVSETRDESREKVTEIREDALKQASGVVDRAAELGGKTSEKARETFAGAESKVQAGAQMAMERAERMPNAAFIGAMIAPAVLSILMLIRHKPRLAFGMWPVVAAGLAMILKRRRANANSANAYSTNPYGTSPYVSEV